MQSAVSIGQYDRRTGVKNDVPIIKRTQDDTGALHVDRTRHLASSFSKLTRGR